MPERYTSPKTLSSESPDSPERSEVYAVAEDAAERIQQEMEKLVSELEKDPKVDAVIQNPEIRSDTSLAYTLPESEGRELKSDHRIAFVIPKEYWHRIVRDVVLQHRKAEQFRKDIGPDKHDPHGAYSEVQLHNDESDEWVGWNDPKGYNPVKYAEHRSASNPESETLHDWVATVGEVTADVLRVTNRGDKTPYSTSQIHGVEIVFFPELEGVNYQERIYTPGTTFIDLEKKRLLPKYGGGSHTEGKYPGAIALNQRGQALYELGSDPGPGSKVENDRLLLELDPSKNLVQVEVSIGDTEHLSEISQKTGRHTRLGYAKLWVGIERAADGNIEWFIQNTNIPPQGVIAGGPHLEQSTINQGDRLIIESRQDTAYIMGWRVAYKEKTEQTIDMEDQFPPDQEQKDLPYAA